MNEIKDQFFSSPAIGYNVAFKGLRAFTRPPCDFRLKQIKDKRNGQCQIEF
jgi:hypothetical protein